MKKKGKLSFQEAILFVVPLLIPLSFLAANSLRPCPTHWFNCPSTAEVMLDTAPYATEAEVESASLKLLVRERGRCPSAIDYKVYTYGSGFVQTGWIDYIPSQAEIHVRAETKINTPDVPIWVWSHVQDSNLKAVVAQFGSLQDLKRYGCKRIKVNEEEETKESLKVIREFDRE